MGIFGVLYSRLLRRLDITTTRKLTSKALKKVCSQEVYNVRT